MDSKQPVLDMLFGGERLQNPIPLFYDPAIYGARVGDLFMSLIHTCELNGVNPFDYLIALQKHAEELAKHPAAWMPWNYRETLQQMGASQPST